jgi:uncharacterized protein YjgD (DUF1641 family)
MAVPIPIKPDTPESVDEIRRRLDQARVTHAKAVLSAYELLEQLNDRGVMEVLRGALGAGDSIVAKLATAMSTPESINAFRNLVSLARILGSIDPEVLHRFADEITREKPGSRRVPDPSIWSTVKILSSKDSRRALAGAAAFVQAFGRALANGRRKG